MFAGPGHPASPRNRGRIARGTAAHGDDAALAPVVGGRAGGVRAGPVVDPAAQLRTVIGTVWSDWP